MSLTALQRHELKKLIKELEQYRGRHTELVTVYIPKDYEIVKIIQHLAQEQGTASNIKSSSTRKNVTDALERMIQHLRLYKQTPPNGLMAFAGNVAEREGQSDVKVWSIEPPVPLNQRIYRCDKEFVLDALRDMIETKEVYGLIVVDRRDATIALLKGKTIIPVMKTHSEVPGKFRAGGQCLAKDTLVQLADGNILPIDKLHESMDVKSMENVSLRNSQVQKKWQTRKNKVYTICVKYPKSQIQCSQDHVFFVATPQGIREKAAQQLRVGEYLIMPEHIDIKGEVQKIHPEKYHNAFAITSEGRDLLLRARRERSLLQRDLARSIGVTQTTISSYEIGKINANTQPLNMVCTSLDIDFQEFLQNHTSSIHRNQPLGLHHGLTPEFALFLGYFMGDGSLENDRATFSEQDEYVAIAYKKRFDRFFNILSSYRYRPEKHYHQLRFTSRPLVRLIRAEFPETLQKLDSQVPSKILNSKNNVVAAFLKGLYDAEGYVSGGKVGIGMNHKTLIHQTHLILLRFGILASLHTYDNRSNPYSNNPRYTLQISEKESIERFHKHIGFTSLKKIKKLYDLERSKASMSRTRRIIVPGNEIGKLLKAHGYSLPQFSAPSFFTNKRMMSKEVFYKGIIQKIKREDLREELLKIYRIPFVPVKIQSIQITKKPTEMVDISVAAGNFIANGLLVHNSALRFARQREGAIRDHYKKVADHVMHQFLDNKDLKGIILGGPGPSKYDFMNGEFLTNELRKKIIAIKDLSYTEEIGLQELLDKSQDVLAQEEVADEKKIMAKFFELLAKRQAIVTYGEQATKKQLGYGAVETLLLSEALSDEKIEEFEKIAKEFGTEVKLISVETREGVQLRDMGKFAAILRYEVHE